VTRSARLSRVAQPGSLRQRRGVTERPEAEVELRPPAGLFRG